jgi:hypothetical protein
MGRVEGVGGGADAGGDVEGEGGLVGERGVEFVGV